MIKFIFGISLELPVLAHSLRHRVTGLTLPPVDANKFFIIGLSLSGAMEKKCPTSIISYSDSLNF